MIVPPHSGVGKHFSADVLSFRGSAVVKHDRDLSVISVLALQSRDLADGELNMLNYIYLLTFGVNLLNSATQLGTVERGAATRNGPLTPCSIM